MWKFAQDKKLFKSQEMYYMELKQRQLIKISGKTFPPNI